jgi:hypothetical protein
VCAFACVGVDGERVIAMSRDEGYLGFVYPLDEAATDVLRARF